MSGFHSADLAGLRAYSIRHDGLGFRPPGLVARSDRHFTLAEFVCKDGTDNVFVHLLLVDLCEEVRDAFGPWTPASAYRTVAHHFGIYAGFGDPSPPRLSDHLFGLAVDKHHPKPLELARWAKRAGVGAIGVYSWGCHLGVAGRGRLWGPLAGRL